MINRILSWLIEAASTIIKKVVIQADFLKVQQKLVESKADAEEVKRLQDKLRRVELDCDEARQRGMKGNLVLHSPATSASSIPVASTEFLFTLKPLLLQAKELFLILSNVLE